MTPRERRLHRALAVTGILSDHRRMIVAAGVAAVAAADDLRAWRGGGKDSQP